MARVNYVIYLENYITRTQILARTFGLVGA